MLNNIDEDILADASEVGNMELARLASQAIADRTKEIAALQAQLSAMLIVEDMHPVVGRRLAVVRHR
jgi:hypothetical protein